MTYKLDYTFFNNVNTEAQAYCLGYFYVRASGHIQLNIQDIQVLQTIVGLIGYNGPIRVSSTIAEINIQQAKFTNQLLKLGCALNNKYTISFPIIQNDLLPHFIRAIFENYGRLVLCKKKYLNISIIFNEQFIQELRQYLLRNLYISTKHYYRYTHTNSVQMMITRTNDAENFLNWLYKDANYYMTRKFVEYQKYRQKGV